MLNDVTRFRLLDQFKSDLVATVSHELKTPLTAVRLAVHLLLEETVGPLTPKQTELLVDARDNAERLLALIEQLLALARLQRTQDRAAFQPEDPAELLRRAADAVRPRAEDKHVELEVDRGRAAAAGRGRPGADRRRRSATCWTTPSPTRRPAGGSRCRPRRPATAGWCWRSRTPASAFPPEYLPHVFERFFRVPGQSDEAGTGLGLAIVQEIVAAHGGEITCESEPGKGTTFRITLAGGRRRRT